MNSTNRKGYIIALAITFLISCTTTKDDIDRLLTNEDYEEIYSFIESQINDREAEVRPMGSDQETVFEVALLGLLFSKSDHVSQTSQLIIADHKLIGNQYNLDDLIWNEIFEKDQAIPDGIHQYLYMSYDFNKLDQVVINQFKDDPQFLEFVETDLIETIQTNIFDMSKLKLLAEIGGYAEVTASLNNITNLLRQKNEAEGKRAALKNSVAREQESRQNANYEAKNELDRQISRLKRDISNTEKVINQNESLEKSYHFRGYMVAYLGEFSVGLSPREVYEVKNMSGTVYVLVTTNTSFQSKGFFTLRVVETIELPFRLKESYGSFKTNIQALLEVEPDKWTKYSCAKDDLKDLGLELDKLNGKRRALNSNVSIKASNSDRNIKLLDDEIEKYVDRIKAERKKLVGRANKRLDN